MSDGRATHSFHSMEDLVSSRAVRAAFIPALLVPFLGGLGLAVVTSGGLVEERVSLGSVYGGLVVNAFVTVAAVILLVLAQRAASGGAPRAARLAQAIGAAAGILGVHLALHVGWVAGAPWLTERPLQLVNDAVAVFATLGVVWACAEGVHLGIFAVAITLVLAYRVTGGLWHLDAAPQAFSVSVQNLVMAQFAAVAVAVALYRTVVPRPD